MQILNMFPTQVWVENLDIDNEKFLERIYKFSKTKESTPRSSVGGYQGYEMDDIESVSYTHLTLPTSDLV